MRLSLLTQQACRVVGKYRIYIQLCNDWLEPYLTWSSIVMSFIVSTQF
jgi:hypothetical protein